jgi:hypothetical protein
MLVVAYMAIFKCVGLFIYFYFHIFKDSASLFFWFTEKHAERDHVKRGSEKKQPSRILKYMKIKIYEESYTLEDGHVDRNM